jgi:hypothetical protein
MSDYIYATTTGVYSTDGTAAGTTLLQAAGADFVPQPGTQMVTLPNGKVLFFALVNPSLDLIGAITDGIRIWETDGTAIGTTLVADVPAPDGLTTPGDSISNVEAIGDNVSFAFNVPGSGSLLYVTNGTQGGTTTESSDALPQTGMPSTSAVVGGSFTPKLIFATSAGVYSTDGTAAGTTPLQAAGADFVPQPATQMVALPNGKVLFFALVNPSLDFIGALTAGIRIWETDGTATGTTLVADIPAPDGLTTPGDSISNVEAIGDNVSFAFNVPGSGSLLYVTNGTQGGTTTESSGALPQTGMPSTSAVVGGSFTPKLIFATSAGVYSTDGTAAGTTLLQAAGADFVPQPGSQMVTLPDGKVLFVALVNPSLDLIGALTAGIRIWETDGTATGTTLVADIPAPDGLTTPGDSISNAVAIGNNVSFAFNVPGSGSILYVTNGTPAGTATEQSATLPQTGLSNGADTLCFRRATMIRTGTAEVAVENLRAGDTVETVFGGLRRIKWIGRQSFDGRFLGQARAPVCFHAGSIADDAPTRDLHVSPAHGMVIDGRLVPAWFLVNGATVTQTASTEQVDYFHLDLGVHDCVIANGAPSESYAEQNNRTMFYNKAEFDATFPGHDQVFQPFCLPLVQLDSRELNTIRAMLLSRVPEACFTDDPDLHVVADGVRIDPERVDHRNWAFAIPAGVRDLRLASRASRPCAFGQNTDIRDLGFCIEQVSSEQATQTVVLKAHHVAFEIGVYGPESRGESRWRWTNGLCELPEMLLGQTGGQPGEAALVTVTGYALGRYLVPAQRPVQAASG